MAAFFEFVILVTIWLCYLAYRDVMNTKDKKLKEEVNNIDSKVYASRMEYNNFVSVLHDDDKRKELISSLSDELEEIFGSDWEDKMSWNSITFYGGRSMFRLGEDMLAILYFARNGKIVFHQHSFVPSFKDEMIKFFKVVEKHIQKEHPNMRMIFRHDMMPDLENRGKFVVNDTGAGVLSWEYYYKQYRKDPGVFEYLW